MTTEQGWLAAIAGVACALALAAVLLALRARRGAARAEARHDALADRVALLESPVTTAPGDRAAGARDAATFVITGLSSDDEATRGEQLEQDAVVARAIDGRLFTDIVARETVVRAASLGHGLRRALSAESRNRIRFAVRQETRRAGRERRSEMKQALREFRARERAAVTDDLGEDVA